MMATKDATTKQPRARNAAAAAGPERPTRYDADLYGWAVEQARLLRAGRLTEIDAPNIAEELDDVGNEQYDKLESALAMLLLHLLKWEAGGALPELGEHRSRAAPPCAAGAKEKPRPEAAPGRSCG